ncbi:TraX family protein [Pseudomonas reidholzensis]|uniref:TraX family protein n=1 Tax=Pseudomonas reidholzensis TaxID=1785162 RepID=A0A383S023_9PSED|nr:TraX family protein [Pseudomonas reidholzensis]SYX91988.1 TraX family protein [Pseudomonas reidholzensis]
MRSAGLDLVKWLAMLSMLADHLRFLWPGADGLFIVGRLAFPLFCLALALNVQRSAASVWPAPNSGRYLGWLLAFAVLSEGPYRWLDTGSQTLNVIPTLALGLLVAWGVHHAQAGARVLAIGAAVFAAFYSEQLMYGLPGVLLPAAVLIAYRQGGAAWLLPSLLAMAGNLTNSWLREHPLQPLALLVLTTAALAVPLGVLLVRQAHWPAPRVGRWGYGFYPLHLLVIKGLQGLTW